MTLRALVGSAVVYLLTRLADTCFAIGAWCLLRVPPDPTLLTFEADFAPPSLFADALAARHQRLLRGEPLSEIDRLWQRGA